ncbi:RRP12-like protein isoform X2 [Limulus polyphemus]|uniref:RRP12-like protein isoform X2 n=1 Tax=Limulus polyphemus TaxID=6850 RepID=A0ABM1BDH5_LIMPO|nr:RRP12-like protein isoform X2 [Limulus polyphemus]
MGSEKRMKVARKATKGKGKQWENGQSSSSNPKTRKFRNQARSKFFNFNPILGNGQLTELSLAQHDALQKDKSTFDATAMDEDSEAKSEGGKTINTFASCWSECSNPSFQRLLKNWQASSAHHKEMLAVLAAITEVIKIKEGKETETEYFAALMTTLETVETEKALTAVVSLLSMVIKRLPPSVLKLKFSETSKVFVNLLGKFINSNHNALLRGLIGCLSTLLRAQDAAVWNNSSTLQVYSVLLNCITHSKPKVRKAAQHSVSAILKGSTIVTSTQATAHHPATSVTANFCIEKIEKSGGSGAGATLTLHILCLLKEILMIFPYKSLKAVCETLLKVMTLGNMLVTSCSLQALYGLFAGKSSPTNLTAELNAQIVMALYDYQPSINDAQSLIAWLTVMSVAFQNLQKLDFHLSTVHAPKLFSTVVQCWLSEKTEVLVAVTAILQLLINNCIKPSVEELEAMNESEAVTFVQKVFHHLEAALKYQYHVAWGEVIKVLTTFFEGFGKTFHPVMKKGLQSLADLRDTFRFPYTAELDRAMGAAIKTMGPETVLQIVPLQIDGKDDNPEFPRSWLLPVLRDYVQETQLAFFTKYFLPLASVLREKSLELEKSGRIVESKTYSVLQTQIWSLLPGFCTQPTDLTESFKGIAKILGLALSEHPDLRLDILASLRLLVLKNLEIEVNRNELARYAKNYLPIMLNLYTSEPEDNEEGIRLAVYETIKVYLQITDRELCSSLFDKSLLKLKESDITSFSRHAVLDLTRALLLYVSEDQVKELYFYCKPLLQHEDHTIQKKAYRVLEELCQGQSEGCCSFVQQNLHDLQELLIDALSKSVPSAKAPRLRCLLYVLEQQTKPNKDFVMRILPEAILCVKTNAEKARTAAYNLIVEIGKAFLRWDREKPKETLSEYMQLLLGGLVGTPHMISASILSISKVLYEFKDQLPSELVHLLVENMCLLLTSRSREVVQSALSFVKILFSTLSVNDLAQHVEFLVKSLVSVSDESQRQLRFKTKEIFIRLVRKFGYEMIAKMVPPIHCKMLSNIRKIEAHKAHQRKMKESEKEREEDDFFKMKKQSESIEEILQDTDDDLEEEMFNKERPKKKAVRRLSNKVKGATWIEEHADKEIVDFLDPSANKKVMATKPTISKPNKTDHGFKTSADGRLIITEEKKEWKSEDEDIEKLMEAMEKTFKSKKRKMDEDNEDEPPSSKYQVVSKGIHRTFSKPNIQGTENTSKKAGGDVKKKGQHDPYAYIPLNKHTLNRRKKVKLAGQFKNFVSASKKGAQKGAKIKIRMNKRGRK